jgi:acetyl-CoA carboxylase biotin carboxyl carrier protein
VSNNAKKGGPGAGPFDVKTVESLVALMTDHDLSEIYLRDGNQHLRLRRGNSAPAVVVPAVAPTPVLAAAPAAPTPTAPTSAPSAAPAAKGNLLEIKSETVGVFYAQAKPGDPPYIKLGDRVKPETVVGLIIVMKTHNEVTAGCSGVIREILVKNEQSVDFNQVLFRVEP